MKAATTNKSNLIEATLPTGEKISTNPFLTSGNKLLVPTEIFISPPFLLHSSSS